MDSFEFPGLTGMEKLASIMQKLRDQPPVELAGHKVVKVTDYKKPEETGLPASLWETPQAAIQPKPAVARPSTLPVSYTHLLVVGDEDHLPAQLPGQRVAALLDVLLPAHLLEPVADLALGLAGTHDLQPVAARCA